MAQSRLLRLPRFSLFFLALALSFTLVLQAGGQKPELCPAPNACTFRTPDGKSAADLDKANHRNITPPKGSKEGPGPTYQVFDCLEDKCKAQGCHCFILKETQKDGVTIVSKLYDGDSSTKTNEHKLTVKQVELDEKAAKEDKHIKFKYSAVCASNDRSKIWE